MWIPAVAKFATYLMGTKPRLKKPRRSSRSSGCAITVKTHTYDNDEHIWQGPKVFEASVPPTSLPDPQILQDTNDKFQNPPAESRRGGGRGSEGSHQAEALIHRRRRDVGPEGPRDATSLGPSSSLNPRNSMDPDKTELDTVLTQLRKKLDQRLKVAVSLADDSSDIGETTELLTIELGKLVEASRAYASGFKKEKKSLLKIAIIAVETLAAIEAENF